MWWVSMAWVVKSGGGVNWLIDGLVIDGLVIGGLRFSCSVREGFGLFDMGYGLF